jgi:hypothetical protein
MAESAMPDHYDRLLGALDGLPGVLATEPSTIEIITPLLGTSQTFIVRTVRQQDRVERDGKETALPAKFTVFLKFDSVHGLIKVALPPKVADLIARQRDALTTRANKRTARRAAETRKERGYVPTFTKKK